MENLVFNATLPVVPALSVAGLVWTIALALEWRRNHRFRILRLVAVTAATLALLGLVLQPSLHRSANARPILLLTAGYSEQTKDSLLRAHDVALLDWSKADTQQVAAGWHASHARVRFVLGQGLPAPLLRAYPQAQFSFFPSTPASGLSQVQYSAFTAGTTGSLAGALHHPQARATLQLESPDGRIDSFAFEAGSHPFQIPVRAKQPGRYVYQLHVQAGNLPVETAALPIEVLPVRPLRLLFLQQHPTFETRYLKTFLAESGHAVSLRYLVSRNTYRFEFVNAPEQRFQQLRAEVLQPFDLLLISQEAAEQLSATEKSALATAMQNGLGVLLLLSENQPSARLLSEWADFEVRPGHADTVTLRFPGWAQAVTLPAAAWQISHPQLHPLHLQSSPVWAGYVATGMGKLGFQLLTETYPLALGGDKEKYADIWAPLLQALARLQLTNSQIQLNETPPYYPDVTYSLTLFTHKNHPMLELDGQRIPLREDEQIDGLWCGHFRVQQPGWHHFNMHDSTLHSFYVHTPGSLRGVAVNNQVRANQARHTSTPQPVEPVETSQAIPPVLFFLIFLVAAGFLWLSPKL